MHYFKPRLFSVDRFRPEFPDDYTPSAIQFISYYSLFITVIFILHLTLQTISVPTEVQALKNPVVLASTAQPTLTPISMEPRIVSALKTPEPTGGAADPIAQREEIHQYIKTIFGRDAATAYAISLAEGKARERYKGEVVYNTAAVHKTASEYSVGIFQINVKSDYAKVHFDRIPGSSLDEKVAWLKDPYNNTLFAYWVYSTHSNFEPWSVYTGGLYLAYLK